MIVIGGGPIGLELAQAHLRLGSRVTVLEGLKALGKDDPEMSEVVLKRLRAEGVADPRRRAGRADRRRHRRRSRCTSSEDGAARRVQGTHLLLATGRSPNVADLSLEAARIKYDKRGIQVNQRARDLELAESTPSAM